MCKMGSMLDLHDCAQWTIVVPQICLLMNRSAIIGQEIINRLEYFE